MLNVPQILKYFLLVKALPECQWIITSSNSTTRNVTILLLFNDIVCDQKNTKEMLEFYKQVHQKRNIFNF